MEILRNLGRRKLRTSLTVFGIAIGIFALAVMGSLSEYLTTTVDAGIRYSGDIIRVLPATSISGAGAGAMREATGDPLKNIAHVKLVTGGIEAPLSNEGVTNPFNAKFGIGVNPEATADIFAGIPLDSGRYLQAGDGDVVMIGHNLASADNLQVGSIKEIKGQQLTVVGIFKPTQVSQIDDFAVVPLKTLQQVLGAPDVVSFFIVVPDSAANAQAVADTINKDYKSKFHALSPKDIQDATRQGLLIFTIIILAGAALAAVVGGFSTINTMIMSVSERTKEIGIKKAVGASYRQVMGEFLVESAVMGLLGGLIGVGLGKLATIIINLATKSYFGGLEIFSLTPRLALAALLFATVLGAVAGVIPAISAARLNIVKALRTE